MSLTAFASAKGAPGVTLTALTFAAARAGAGSKVIFLEADRSGGTLAVRYQLPRQPGLITLAAAGRHGLARDQLWNHAQELPGGLAAIVAPEREDRASAILRDGGARIGRWLADIGDVDVVVDCGRIDSTDLASGLVAQADILHLVARPTAEEIQPAAALAAEAVRLGLSVSWVLIGDCPHHPDEVASVTGVAVAAVLPDDRRGAAALLEGQGGGRGRRSRVARAIHSFAATSGPTHPPSGAVQTQTAPDADSLEVAPALLAAPAAEVAR